LTTPSGNLPTATNGLSISSTKRRSQPQGGIQFGYHNHFWEFPPQEPRRQAAYDYLLESHDPRIWKMELDLCWITVAGKDPLAYFKKYPGRFALVHVQRFSKIRQSDPSKASKRND